MIEAIHQWLHDRRPDSWVQRRQFQLNFGRPLRVKDPQTFNEKLHWLMRNDRRSVLTQCADKLAVHDYVRDRVGASYLPKLYGDWVDPDTIDFSTMPSRYVLKTTHGSGQNILVPDSSRLDEYEARKQLASWLTRSNYWLWRERAYKDIPPRVMAEEWLGELEQSPPDYKFFCFNGTPRIIQLDTNRFTQHNGEYFDLDWDLLPFTITYKRPSKPSPRPAHLDEMLHVAQSLSHGHPFVRVDLYDLPSRVVFGEMTWYPGGASEHFTPESWDLTLGSWLTLPSLEDAR